MIIEETERVRSTAPIQLHQARTYADAAKGLADQEVWRKLAFTPAQFHAYAIIDPMTGKALEYRDPLKMGQSRDIWSKAFIKEVDGLAQGKCGHKIPTNTIFFIKKQDIPPGRTFTYGCIVVDYRPQKEIPTVSASQ